MRQYPVVAVNRALARFFTLEPVDFPELESGPRMTVPTDLENQELKDGGERYRLFPVKKTWAPRGRGRGVRTETHVMVIVRVQPRNGCHLFSWGPLGR
jgi:hypothetical protein